MPHTPQLMGHIIAGYPSLEASLYAALGICRAGASYLEVQFPFSDPNADGVVIEEACHKSLESGFKSEQGFRLLGELSARLEQGRIPTKLLIMTYANIIFAYGIERFLKRAQECGVWGIIVPDLPLDSDENLRTLAPKYHIAVISLIAPRASSARIRQLDRASEGLIYVVARAGTTGSRTQIDEGVLEWLAYVKQRSKKPIALGFGIQSREQVRALEGNAPIIVAGSYFVKRIGELDSQGVPPQAYESALTSYAKELMGW